MPVTSLEHKRKERESTNDAMAMISTSIVASLEDDMMPF